MDLETSKKVTDRFPVIKPSQFSTPVFLMLLFASEYIEIKQHKDLTPAKLAFPKQTKNTMMWGSLLHITQDRNMETDGIRISKVRRITIDIGPKILISQLLSQLLLSGLLSGLARISRVAKNINSYGSLLRFFIDFSQNETHHTKYNEIMIINIQNNQYPFNCYRRSHQHTGNLVQRIFRQGSSPLSHLLIQKVHRMIDIPLAGLILIKFYQETPEAIYLYYQKIDHHLSELIEDMDAVDIKIMHQQFIELVINLAKEGIITTFDSKNCGGSHQVDGIALKYYLDPVEVIITQDIEVIEEAVYNFCQAAMHFLLSCGEKTLPPTNCCISESKLQFHQKHSVESSQHPSSTSIEDKIHNSRLSMLSKRESINKRQRKETSLRKLSVMSRQLSEISARHRGLRNVFPQLDSKISLETVNTGKDSMEYLRQSQPLSPILPTTSPIPTSHLLTRSRRAQELLRQVRERLTPYHQIYTILKQIKLRS